MAAQRGAPHSNHEVGSSSYDDVRPDDIPEEEIAVDTGSMRRRIPRNLSGSFSAPTSPIARPVRSPVDWTPRTAIADAVRARTDAVRARIDPHRAMSEAGSLVAEKMEEVSELVSDMVSLPLRCAGVGIVLW